MAGFLWYMYTPKDPDVSPKISGYSPKNPMTWGWDGIRPSIIRSGFLGSWKFHGMKYITPINGRKSMGWRILPRDPGMVP